ncbi:helix-turn-helix domain-containing protein [Clostridium sulfidigenes]|uniref:helix-turn-helix domain-containing protein n=1 Tax=Clostridium sulfidigenes TaxID=318464 RepID=UPI003F8BCF2A
MSIGENIRIARKNKNITMKQLGENLGITEQAISQYERGVRTPNTKLILKISSILEVNPTDIDPELKIWDEFDEKMDLEGLRREVKIAEILSQVSTEQLIEELNGREDFPISISLK